MDLDDIYRIDGYLSGKAIASEIIKRADDPNIIYRTNDTVLGTDAVKKLAKYITRLKYENEELKENYMNAQASANMVFDKVIPVQKVKDIFDVEIYNFNYLSKTDWSETQAYIDKTIANTLERILQKLLEGRNKNE